MRSLIVVAATVILASPVLAQPSVRHPQIFQSMRCVAQWVDLPGPRVWFTGFIKNTGPDGSEGPIFKTNGRLTWWGDDSFRLAAAALLQLQKSCPEVEVAGLLTFLRSDCKAAYEKRQLCDFQKVKINGAASPSAALAEHK
jgi:hypothetical protein